MTNNHIQLAPSKLAMCWTVRSSLRIRLHTLHKVLIGPNRVNFACADDIVLRAIARLASES